MSEEEKKKKKKKAIIAGIIGSVALIGGGIGGTIEAIPETEAKNEEENEEEKKKPSTPNPKSQPILKIDLQTTLPQDKRNLGTIATNGASTPTEQMIKDKLPANIQNEVDISIQSNKAILTAKANSKYKGNFEVNYTLDTKQDLATTLPQDKRNLGTIATNGASTPTEQMIKDKLPANIQNEVDISIQSNKAILTAKANSKYKGNFEVNYTLDTKQDLATTLPQDKRNLGTIATNGASTPTEQMIKDKLPANIQNEVDISIQSNKAILTAKANSKYKGNFEVNYTLDTKQDLATTLPQDKRNLGTIATNGASTPTEQMIKDKLPANIQNEVDISIQSNKAILTAKANSKYKGNFEVNYTLDTKQDLATTLPQDKRNLGTIATNGASTPTEQMIKDKLPANIQNEVDISIQSNKAILTAKANSKYKGNPVTVTFTVDKKIELATALSQAQRNLGTIATNGQEKPTAKQIAPELAKKSIDTSQVEITNISTTQATVSAKTGANAKYKGNPVTVTFTVDKKIELATALSQAQRNLGTIATNGASTPTEQMIKDKLPANIQNEVDISIQSNKAILTAKANSKYKGNFEVNYTLDTKQDLATTLPQDKRNLGTIATNGASTPTEQMIKDKLPANIQNEVDISIQSNKAILTAKANAKYKGNPVTVTFTVDKKIELATALSQAQRNLGTIATNGQEKPTAKQIAPELAKKSIDTSQVEITNISTTQATVSAKTGANAKYKGNPVTVTFTVDKKIELATALSQAQRNLGTIATNGQEKPTAKQIAPELAKKSIDTSQVEITNISATQATVSAKTGANAKYKGNPVTVTFTVDKKIELATALSQAQRNLGTIATNGASTPTEQMIKDKLPANIQNEVDISIQSNKAILTAKANAKYKGIPVTVTFTVDKKIELATALSQAQRNLGTIATNGQEKPTAKQIAPELAKKSIDTSQVEITNISATQATVSAKTGANAKYKGNPVTVTFTVDKKIELATALSQAQRNLGTIATNGQEKPTAKQIAPELAKKSIDTSQVEITNISATQATVSAKTGANAKYKGNPVTVTFTVDKKIELATALSQAQRNLGTIATNGQEKPTAKQIAPELAKKSIDTSQVEITNISATQATVSAKTGANAKYKGNPVTVTFTVDKKIELATALSQAQRNLGTIATNGQEKPTAKQIAPELAKKSIDTSQVEITNISATQATVSAKTGANAKYKGNPVTVTFTVDKKIELATALSQAQRNLGTIATNGASTPTEQMIKDKLPANIQNEVDISIQSNKAILTAKANSKYKGNPVTVTYTLDTKQDLATFLKTPKFNLINTRTYDKNEIPSKQEIKNRIKLTHKELDINEIDIENIDISFSLPKKDGTEQIEIIIHVVSKLESSKYKGWKNMTYTFVQKK